MLGESVTMRKLNGRVVIKNRPRRKVVADPTEKQLVVFRKFKEAAQWAKKQIAKPDVDALYAARVTDKVKSAFLVAVTDYLTAPTVESIDASQYNGAIGDAITAKVVDDFMVTKVTVIITDPTGKILEQGQATQDPDMEFLWSYAATVANSAVAGTTVSVTGQDRARNQTVLEKVL